MRKRNLLLCVFFTLLLFVFGCNKPQIEQSLVPEQKGCIQSDNNWVFPVAQYTENYHPVDIPPPSDWESKATLPDSFSSGYEGPVFLDGNIWIIGHTDADWNKRAGLRYNTQTNEWEIYNSIEGVDFDTDEFLVSPNGTLWGISLYSSINTAPSSIIRYDEQKNNFYYAKDPDGILKDEIGKITGAAFDKKDHLWLISEAGLYEVDPVSLQVSKRVSAQSSSYFKHIDVAPDGKIWVMDSGKNFLFQYNPGSNDFIQFTVNDSSDRSDSIQQEKFDEVLVMYFDRKGNLWLDDRGWIDFAKPSVNGPLWNRIVRSPVFIDNSYLPDSKYSWGRPYRIYESSNGIYWFSSFAGLVRLNPNLGEWCRISTQGSVVEDDKHTLWLLYKQELYEQLLIP